MGLRRERLGLSVLPAPPRDSVADLLARQLRSRLACVLLAAAALGAVLARMADGVIVAGAAGRITYVDDAAPALHGGAVVGVPAGALRPGVACGAGVRSRREVYGRCRCRRLREAPRAARGGGAPRARPRPRPPPVAAAAGDLLVAGLTLDGDGAPRLEFLVAGHPHTDPVLFP